jgi:hypothetical protein
LIIAAPFSAIMIVGALVLVELPATLAEMLESLKFGIGMLATRGSASNPQVA